MSQRAKRQRLENNMGNMVRMKVSIKGTRPLLQHRFGPDAIPLEKGERTGVAGNDPENWRSTCMVADDGTLYIDGTYVFGCLRDAAKHTKKGKGSLQSAVAATLLIEETAILLDRTMPGGDRPTTDPTQPVYIDVRGVRNPANKARNVRYRLACSAGWQCSFTLVWDRTIVSRDQMRAIINDASTLTGIGDGRSIGFGRFMVTKWEEVQDAEETPAEGSVGGPTENRLEPRRKKVRPVQEEAHPGNGAL
jgi:hypothetical protein